MPVPEVQSQHSRWPFRCATGIVAALVLAACGTTASGSGARGTTPKADRQSKQWVQLSLDSLGFPGVSDTFLRTGSSMLTVHFLDDSHLLVTFSLRDLVPRLAGDPKTDDDRLVAAEIVELPSGKIGARTVWHMHDHGRYLWKLGSGRFLVRIAGRLSTMAPLAKLDAANPFQRTALPGQEYSPSAVFVSPDGGLITVESVVSYVDPDGRAAALLGDVDADKPVTRAIIKFFRIESEKGSSSDTSGSALQVTPAGTVISAQPVLLPLDSDGYLGAEETGHDLWSMSFDEFGGKTIGVGELESSCIPRLQMVSRGEFVAFACRGSEQNVKLASYGLDGHETWEEGLGDLGSPVFAFAPAAGRFAISRETPEVPANAQNREEGTPARQEVRVYQNASGDLLLRVECSPVFKSGENFDLSADGLLAAVVRNSAISIYKLPPPDKGDLQDMAEVAKFAPPASLGPVTLKMAAEPAETRSAADGDGRATVASSATAASVAVDVPSTPAASKTGSSPAANSATGVAATSMAAGVVDTPATAAGARKPPTLLHPGEKPEFGSSNAEQPD